MRITQAYKLCLLTYKTSARSGAGLLVALLCTMLSSVAGRSGVIGFVLLNQGTSRFPRCLTRPLYDRALLASLAQLPGMKCRFTRRTRPSSDRIQTRSQFALLCPRP